MAIEVADQIEKFKDFLEITYIQDIHNLVRKGRKSLIIDFSELARFDPELAEQLLDEPDDVIKAAEMALEQFDLVKTPLNVRIRNLPESETVTIKNIRSVHL